MSLRQDCRTNMSFQSSTSKEDKQWLKILEKDLSNSLNNWFSAGLAKVERVTWDSSSAELLENLFKSEQVHKIVSVDDFKYRLNLKNRRVFAYCHPVTGKNEPLVILYVALVNEISDSVDELIRPDSHTSDKAEIIKTENPDTAIFYSISSRGNQLGLQGIDLGNQMIKQLVGVVQM